MRLNWQIGIAVLGLLAVVAMGAEKRILIHGHRGARAVRPENTMAAFEYAIKAGADYLELDLAVTKDGVLVVSHDAVLPKSICQGPEGATRAIHQMTLAELRRWDCGSLKNPEFPRQQPSPGEKVPTLAEVLALAPRGEFGFNIEVKVPRDTALAPPVEEFARKVVEAVRKHGLEKRVIVQSFDFRATRAVHRLAPEIKVAALTARDQREFPEVAREAHASIISPQFRLVTPEKVKRAHDAGLEVVPWTANDPKVWQQLAAAGVDAIITDDPAGLKAWLGNR